MGKRIIDFFDYLHPKPTMAKASAIGTKIFKESCKRFITAIYTNNYFFPCTMSFIIGLCFPFPINIGIVCAIGLHTYWSKI